MANNKVVLSDGTTLIDLSSDTVTQASHIMAGYVGHLADGSQVTGTGSGGPSATAHTIYLEFADGTDLTIPVYYDNALLGTMITSYDPSTYGDKTVDSASLDGVVWYERPTETWETLFDGYAQVNDDTPYNSFWISALSNVYITMGSIWRVTLNGATYRCTVTYQGVFGPEIGNPLYSGGQDDGSGVPFDLFNAGWGAWSGGVDLVSGQYPLKIERQGTA